MNPSNILVAKKPILRKIEQKLSQRSYSYALAAFIYFSRYVIIFCHLKVTRRHA